eukprot:SAG11_NODE_6138_length_1380_cov_2.311475_1_plen_325_part_00
MRERDRRSDEWQQRRKECERAGRGGGGSGNGGATAAASAAATSAAPASSNRTGSNGRTIGVGAPLLEREERLRPQLVQLGVLLHRGQHRAIWPSTHAEILVPPLPQQPVLPQGCPSLCCPCAAAPVLPPLCCHRAAAGLTGSNVDALSHRASAPLKSSRSAIAVPSSLSLAAASLSSADSSAATESSSALACRNVAATVRAARRPRERPPPRPPSLNDMPRAGIVPFVTLMSALAYQRARLRTCAQATMDEWLIPLEFTRSQRIVVAHRRTVKPRFSKVVGSAPPNFSCGLACSRFGARLAHVYTYCLLNLGLRIFSTTTCSTL